MASSFEYLIDNNEISEILKGNREVANYVVDLKFAICAIVYIEAVQGSISNTQKLTIRKLVDNFPLLPITSEISNRAIDLILKYSNSHGLLLADALIAASSIENNLTVLTYNINDFRFIEGLRCLKPIV